MLVILFVIFLFVKTNGYRNILVNNNSEEFPAEIGNQISNLLTLQTGLILVTNSVEDYENTYVNFFLKNCGQPLEVTYKKLSWTLVKPNRWNNFIVVSNMEKLEKDIRVFVHRRGYYFFILTDETEVDYNKTLPLFEMAWHTRRKIHLYFLTSKNGVMAYDPFAYDSSREDYGVAMNLADRKDVDKLFIDLNGYPLSIEIFRSVYSLPIMGKNDEVVEAIGADAEVAYEIARYINFSIIFAKPDQDNFGHLTENGTFNGALGRVLTNKVDVTLTSFFIKDYFATDMEFTVAVYADQLCCYVPKANRVPQSILPLFSFSPLMWICYFLTSLVCGSVWSLMRCFNLTLFRKCDDDAENRWKRFQFIQIYIDTWIVWVRVSLRKWPGFHSEKLFVGSVCLVSVIFGAIFESKLASVYLKPLYYKDITTLQELDASGYKIYYKYASMLDDTFGGSSPMFKRLRDKMHFVKFKESVMVRLSRDGGFASLTRKSSINLENLQFFASKELFMIPECPKDYTLAYLLPKDSPYADRINLLLLRFLQAGLIDKWIDRMHFQAKLEDMINPRRISQSGAKVLALSDLQLPFIVLLSGGVLGFVTLLSEIYLMRKRLKKASTVEYFK